jgi:hypothetical protein
LKNKIGAGACYSPSGAGTWPSCSGGGGCCCPEGPQVLPFSRVSRNQRALSFWAMAWNLHLSVAGRHLQRLPKSLSTYFALLFLPFFLVEAAATFLKFSATKKMYAVLKRLTAFILTRSRRIKRFELFLG